MKKGVHTIRSGFSDQHNPTVPRRYILDNGNYDHNMKIKSLQLISNSGALTTNNHDVDSPTLVYFVIATSSAGAIPAASVTPNQYSIDYGLRLEDSAQIAWGMINQPAGSIDVIVDPGHIIPQDLYINAYCLGDTGTPTTVASGISFLLTMEDVKSSGSEALLYQIKETASRN